MLSIVGLFGCAKVLVFLGYNEICRYFFFFFFGMSKFVGIFWGLKSGLQPSPCSRQKSEYPHHSLRSSLRSFVQFVYLQQQSNICFNTVKSDG